MQYGSIFLGMRAIFLSLGFAAYLDRVTFV